VAAKVGQPPITLCIVDYIGNSSEDPLGLVATHPPVLTSLRIELYYGDTLLYCEGARSTMWAFTVPNFSVHPGTRTIVLLILCVVASAGGASIPPLGYRSRAHNCGVPR
jgi:hypothetical protein